MKNKMSRLTPREKLFCVHYANSADTEQSAISAGYKNNPMQKGEQLLAKSIIADEIASIVKIRERAISQIARLGFEKLAFGSIADAVSLLYMDTPTKETLSKMDLFMVSEIKKLKDGAMEIKFFDRLKALQNLSDEKASQQENTGSLIQALTLGAQNIADATGDVGEL